MQVNELYHHGIRGQRWGKRNGPPYPLKGGSYSASEIKKKYQQHLKNDVNNKRHFDKEIKKGSELSTLSYDKDRTKDSEMFYASYDTRDKDKYKFSFNKKVDQPIYDANGEQIGTGKFYKYQISNKAVSSIKVASEDSGADAFKKLYSNSRDFYNFVTNKERMESVFDFHKYKFSGYREARAALNRIREQGDKASEKDLNTVYRMFNYVIPSDGRGDSKARKDVATQRARLFNELKKNGYGALLDTNDAIYGGYKANAPVIVFDMNQVIPDKVKRLKTSDKVFAALAYNGKKLVGL